MADYRQYLSGGVLPIENLLLTHDDEEVYNILQDVMAKDPNLPIHVNRGTLQKKFKDNWQDIEKDMSSRGVVVKDEVYHPLEIEGILQQTGDDDRASTVIDRALAMGYPLSVLRSTVEQKYGKDTPAIIDDMTKRGVFVFPDEQMRQRTTQAISQQRARDPFTWEMLSVPTAQKEMFRDTQMQAAHAPVQPPAPPRKVEIPFGLGEFELSTDPNQAGFAQRAATRAFDAAMAVPMVAADILRDVTERPKEMLVGMTAPINMWLNGMMYPAEKALKGDEYQYKQLLTDSQSFDEDMGRLLQKTNQAATAYFAVPVTAFAMVGALNRTLFDVYQTATGQQDKNLAEGGATVKAGGFTFDPADIAGSSVGLIDQVITKTGEKLGLSPETAHELGAFGTLLVMDQGMKVAKRGTARLKGLIRRGEEPAVGTQEADLKRAVLGDAPITPETKAAAIEKINAVEELVAKSEETVKSMMNVQELAERVKVKEISGKEQLEQYTADMERLRQTDPYAYEAAKFSRMSPEMQVAQLERNLQAGQDAKMEEFNRLANQRTPPTEEQMMEVAQEIEAWRRTNREAISPEFAAEMAGTIQDTKNKKMVPLLDISWEEFKNKAVVEPPDSAGISQVSINGHEFLVEVKDPYQIHTPTEFAYTRITGKDPTSLEFERNMIRDITPEEYAQHEQRMLRIAKITEQKRQRRLARAMKQEVPSAESVRTPVEGAGPQTGAEGQTGGGLRVRDVAADRVEAQARAAGQAEVPIKPGPIPENIRSMSNEALGKLATSGSRMAQAELMNRQNEAKAKAASGLSPLEKKAVEEAQRVDEWRDQDRRLKAVAYPFQPEEILNDAKVKFSDIASDDPVVEARWQAAKLGRKTWFQQAAEDLRAFGLNFTRRITPLDPKLDATVANTIRKMDEVSPRSKEDAMNVMRGWVSGFGPRKFKIYERMVILRDLLGDAQKGHYEGKELPFGYKDVNQIAADLAKFENIAKDYPEISDAINRRSGFYEELRESLIDRNMLPEEVRGRTDYFHRQVVEYYNMKNSIAEAMGGGVTGKGKKGWQKQRTYGAKDWNTDYLQAEYEVLSQAMNKIYKYDYYHELMNRADIKPELERMAAEWNEQNPNSQKKTWVDFVPRDHVVIKEVPSAMLERSASLPEAAIDDMFRLAGESIPDEIVKPTDGKGGKGIQYVIPIRVQAGLQQMRLQGMKNNTFGADLGSLSGFLNRTWKVWKLQNPESAIRYNLNNLSGDADAVFANNPKHFKYAATAAKELASWHFREKAPSELIKRAQKQGVLKASFVAKEISEVKESDMFDLIRPPETGKDALKKVNIAKKYWKTVKAFTQWREDVLRLASFVGFEKQIQNGERPMGASRVVEMQQMYREMDAGRMSVEEVAGKLSRELLVDYGNISRAGQFIRSHISPFYSWVEGNMPRYVRLIKNTPYEKSSGNIPARVAAVMGKRTVTKMSGLMFRATFFVAAIKLWNATMFPDENKELGTETNTPEIILGRREDGTIRTIKFPGALADAIDYFAMDDLPENIAKIWQGKKNAGDYLKEVALAGPVKLFQGAIPYHRAILEALSKRSFYPDPFNPRPIRDIGSHLGKFFSVGYIYDWAMDIPTKNEPLWEDASRLLFYYHDPGEVAYWGIKHRLYDYMADKSDQRPDFMPSARSNALYFYKQAERFGDKELSEKWYNRYIELGGTDKGVSKSIGLMQPLSGLKTKQGDYTREFLDQLSPEEMEMLDRAEAWYNKVYGGAKR